MSGTPTWVPGQVPQAADFDSWFQPLAATKSANQSVISQTTLVNDADLRVALTANSVYQFFAMVRYDTGTTPKIKMSFQVPAGADCRYMGIGQNTGVFGSFLDNAATDNVQFDGAGVGSIRAAFLLGVVFTVGTAGNLIFQWAQQVSNASNTTLHQFSYISAQRIG